jgi:hypothetical protein
MSVEFTDGDVESVQLIVLPPDGKCEGCGDVLGDGEVFEDDMGVVLCRGCWDLCDED